jgi:hypothetical protein
MYSEAVCQVARSWVDVGSFHMRLIMRFIICTASFRNILDTPLPHPCFVRELEPSVLRSLVTLCCWDVLGDPAQLCF